MGSGYDDERAVYPMFPDMSSRDNGYTGQYRHHSSQPNPHAPRHLLFAHRYVNITRGSLYRKVIVYLSQLIEIWASLVLFGFLLWAERKLGWAETSQC